MCEAWENYPRYSALLQLGVVSGHLSFGTVKLRDTWGFVLAPNSTVTQLSLLIVELLHLDSLGTEFPSWDCSNAGKSESPKHFTDQMNRHDM